MFSSVTIPAVQARSFAESGTPLDRENDFFVILIEQYLFKS